MKNYVLTILASCLCSMSVQGAAGGAKAASPAAKSKKLEGMDYTSARKIILRHGWKPVGGACEGVLADTCAKFPEIDVCSGVYPGYCAMKFGLRDRCLHVQTIGGWPPSQHTRVDGVTLRYRRCVKAAIPE